MVYLYENDPGVGFTRTLLTSGLTDIEDLRFTDLDGDAFEDLVILSEDGGRLDWIPRSGGTFDMRQQIDDVAGSSFMVNLPVLEGSMAVADFDGNGVTSIVTVNISSNVVEFREGTGGGAFAAPVTLYDADTGRFGLPLEAGVMDVNDDGRPDLVVAFRAGRASEIVWRENQGGSPATFGPAQLIANENAVAYPSAMQAHDMDLDGTEDLVLAPTYGDRGVVVIPRTGPGQFGDPVSVNSRLQGARGLLVTPLNAGDARPEIVATSDASNEVSVFLNENILTTQTYTSTVNVTGDGLVSFENPGVRIDFQGVTGSGDVTVRLYFDGPAVPVDISEQTVSMYRYTIDAEPSLSFAPTTDVRFGTHMQSGVQVPEDVVIYARDIPGIGTFRPLDTQVQPRNETYELVVQVGSFSEFAYASDNINNPLPVELSNLSADAGVELCVHRCHAPVRDGARRVPPAPGRRGRGGDAVGARSLQGSDPEAGDAPKNGSEPGADARPAPV